MYISYRLSEPGIAYLWYSENQILEHHGYCANPKKYLVGKGNFWLSHELQKPYPDVCGSVTHIKISGFENSKINLEMFSSLRIIEFMEKCKSTVVNVRQPIVRLVAFHVPANIYRIEWIQKSDILRSKLLFTTRGIQYDLTFRTTNLAEYRKSLNTS